MRSIDVILKKEKALCTKRIKIATKALKTAQRNPENYPAYFIESEIELQNGILKMYSDRLNKLNKHIPMLDAIRSELADVYILYVLDYVSYEMIEDLLSWDILNKSPYSDSFYNDNNIGWGYKPLNSLRISDHWNFGDEYEHCKTDIEIYRGWALGRFDGEKYTILKQY